jgi:DNA-directed RNA polymerase subunit RPC12/RpoP
MSDYKNIPIVCVYCDRLVPQSDWIPERARCKYCANRIFVSLDPHEIEYCTKKAIELENSNKETGIHQPLVDTSKNSLAEGISGNCAECAFHKFVGKPYIKTVFRGRGDDGDFEHKGLKLDVKNCCTERFRGLRIREQNYTKHKDKYAGYVAMKKVVAQSDEHWEVVGTITTGIFDKKKKLVQFSTNFPPMVCVEECDLNHPNKIREWAKN